MKITVLGTGTSQGVPIIGCQCEVCQSTDTRDKRLRSSILIEENEKNILIDTSPDLRMQMLANNVQRVDAVLFTHEHNDHTAGLDDLRPFNFMQESDIPLYGQKRVLDELQVRFSYAFTGGAYPGAPRMNPNVIDDVTNIQGLEVIPIPLLHGSLPILGYRIGDFAYLTDVSEILEESLGKLRGLKILMLNALRHEAHHSHLTLQQALDYVNIIQPEKTFLTHIGHDLGRYTDVMKNLPKDVVLSYDGLGIDI